MSASPEDLPIEALDLSVRAYNCLRRAGKGTVGQLLIMNDEELLAIRNLGRNALAEIREKLAARLSNHPELARLTPTPDEVAPLLQPEKIPEVLCHSAMQAPAAVLNLSAQSYDALKQAGCKTVSDIAALGDEGLYWILGSRNQRVIAEIKEQMNIFYSRNPELPRPIPIEALNLSIRPRKALMRHNVFTVDRLAQMSEEAIWGIPNIGEKSVAEIMERLSAFLQIRPLPVQPQLGIKEVETPPPPPPPLALADPELLHIAQEQGVPLTKIAIGRLGLSELDLALLLKAGIETVGELVHQARDMWAWRDDIARRLDQYLLWLTQQDEAAWKNEMENQGVSPLQKIDLAATTVEELARKWLGPLRNREREILYWRYGLSGKTLSLEEVGDNLGITRERVRQIQNSALRKLRRPQRYAIISSLCALLKCMLNDAGGLLNPELLDAALRSELAIGELNPAGVARLVFQLSDDVEWVRETQAWGLTNLPLDQVPAVQKQMVDVLEQVYAPLTFETVISRFKATRYYRSHRDQLQEPFIAACLMTHLQIEVTEDGLLGLRKWSNTRLHKVVLALRQIGNPAHYTIIAEQTNTLLPTDQRTSVRNIQALLDRQSNVFTCLGRGRYWLRDHVLTDMEAQSEGDFGDLFGARLARWQEELDGRQGNSKLDTHAEVDRIRNVGLEFFDD